MKTIKKISALTLCLVLALTLVSCHKKDETAVTFTNGKETKSFTSAMYMYALMEADMEARGKVDAAKTNASSDTSSTAAATDYYSEKIDGKDYETYVREAALDNLRDFAYYYFKAKELGVELTADQESYADSYADYYWNSYGYGASYEPNGVGFATFSEANRFYQLSSAVFEKIYGKGGEKEIAADTVKSSMLENYELADIISVDVSSHTDAEKSALNQKFQGYIDRLKKGETFEKIYCEYNNTEPKNTSNLSTGGVAPVDNYATIVGSDDTNYADNAFADIKKMKVGDAYIDDKTDGTLRLVVRSNLETDAYYVENLDTEVRHLIKQSEYDENVAKDAKEYKIDVNSYAINQFKIKNIVYSTQS